jgi:hypothetical protein
MKKVKPSLQGSIGTVVVTLIRSEKADHSKDEVVFSDKEPSPSFNEHESRG